MKSYWDNPTKEMKTLIELKFPPKTIIPTVKSKISNRDLFILYKSGRIIEIINDNGAFEFAEFDSNEDFIKENGTSIKEYNNITKSILGKRLIKHDSNIVEVRIAIL